VTRRVTMGAFGSGRDKTPAAPRLAMDVGCNFTRGYTPTSEPDTEILLAHVKNCEDCQAESYVLIRGHYAAS
jgi:hypothetical protein